MLNHQKTRINLNLGSSSLLLIFVVLSLVSFSVLSLSTALADKSLTQKNVDKSTNYYSACDAAQKYLEEYDNRFIEVYKTCKNKEEYVSSCEALFSPIIIPVSEYHSLQVIIVPNYPENENDSFYKITSWQTVISSEPNIDFSVNVIK